MRKRRKPVTTNTGQPRISAGDPSNGAAPALQLHQMHLLEELAHLNRERIPERVVHAKGAGAFGYFEAFADLSHLTCANFLSRAGARTEAFVRFSTTSGEKGSAESERDFRGFSVKLYTEEGNYDLVGSNSPVFFIRDPGKFPALVHTQKRHPETGLRDPEMFWDFLSLSPESLHQVTILFSDRGIPFSYRHMNGYGTHTYQWYNERGEKAWVKYHLRPAQGVRWRPTDSAARLRADDPDFYTRDLFEAIAAGAHPEWTVYVQIIPNERLATCSVDPFDPTKVIPFAEAPILAIGRIVLDRNPRNYFAEVEQAAFTPSNFVPGIGPSPDPLLLARVLSYPDAQRYRLGTNHHLVRVNRARAARVMNYQRDGAMRTDDNFGAAANYFPNSQGGPAPRFEPRLNGALPIPPARSTDDFAQAGKLFRHVLREPEQERLITNLASHLGLAPDPIQYRQAALCYRADAEYGRRLARALKLDDSAVARFAALADEQRNEATRWRGGKLGAALPQLG